MTCSLIRPLSIHVLYVHVPSDPTHLQWANRFINSYNDFDPGISHRVIVLCNGSRPNVDTHRLFGENVSYYQHDDTGWDIGAYQAYCHAAQCDMVVCLGGSTYCRRNGWLLNMARAFCEFGKNNLYGAMGNLGALPHVHSHVRSTGFWCSPSLMNAYPIRVRNQDQRYPFEHGKDCISNWCKRSGRQVLVVDADGVYEFPHYHDSPNGYHKGDQSALLIGDRLTEPPYYPHA